MTVQNAKREDAAPKQPKSISNISAKMDWPHLGDKNDGPRAIEDFYNKLEMIFSGLVSLYVNFVSIAG